MVTHIFQITCSPTSGAKEMDSPECWTTLGATAARTSTVRFGPMVSPIAFRNPSVLWRMARRLHSYSKGRLELAVVAGWCRDEYAVRGIRFPSFGERRGQFREGNVENFLSSYHTG
jgi:alkanesulfonate monooxygenase SsuD/methylene tetrahydromethanopterin reductase-like flavin-dependent oxidoreductase (luciferase family)